MEEKIPKVSVLIPAYNAEKFIQRTIMSVLTQTYKNLEIIVLDDGSKDKTGDIVRLMQQRDARIRYYYQDNRGLSDTRNRLISLARGEFIAFIDHDDEWLDLKLEKQMLFFQKNPELGMVFADAYIRNNNKIIGRCFKERKPSKGSVFYRYLFSDNFVPLLTAILSRDILVKFMPFNTNYEVNEEFEMFLRIARDYEFDYINEPLAVYYVHGSNTIISKHRKLIDESFAILDYWIKKDPEINTRYKKSLKNRLAQIYYKKGLYYLSVHDYSQVLSAIVNSFRNKLLNIQAGKLSLKLILNSIGIRKKNNAESAICA
jgi:glycosyltransferase involved in cell wall biosynthesis